MCGITCLGDKVFVVRDSEPEIEVYDVSLSLKHRIKVAGLLNFNDVASCAKNNCLYICDYGGKRVYRVELNGNAINWKVKAQPQSLSVTPKSNIIVTMCDASTLNEFTPDGHLVREIDLHRSAIYPHHAVQLTSGELLVSHRGTQHRVCRTDDDGIIVQYYGGQPGSGTGQLYYPNHLFIDKKGFILVVGSINNQVVLLNSSLTFVNKYIF